MPMQMMLILIKKLIGLDWFMDLEIRFIAVKSAHEILTFLFFFFVFFMFVYENKLGFGDEENIFLFSIVCFMERGH